MPNLGLMEVVAIATLAMGLSTALHVLIRWFFDNHAKALQERVNFLQDQIKHRDDQLRQRDEQIAQLRLQIRQGEGASPHSRQGGGIWLDMPEGTSETGKQVNQPAVAPPISSRQEVPAQIVTRFAAALTGRLQLILGDGWTVFDSVEKEKALTKPYYEVVSVGRRSWDHVGYILRVALAFDEGMPGPVYFAVRAGKDTPYTPPRADIGVRIAEALHQQFGSRRRRRWWPNWEKFPDEYRDWSQPEILAQLGQENADNPALHYFADQMAEMAKTVDAALSQA